MVDDDLYYTRRAERELSLAAAAADTVVKAAHLDMAARCATLRELSSASRSKDAAAATNDAIETIRARSADMEMATPLFSYADRER
jgi:hypothetical protein